MYGIGGIDETFGLLGPLRCVVEPPEGHGGAGPYVVLGFPEEGALDVVPADNPSGSIWLEREADVSRYQGLSERVEVAPNLPHPVPVPDSTRPAGPAIAFGHRTWRAFVSDLAPTEIPSSFPI